MGYIPPHLRGGRSKQAHDGEATEVKKPDRSVPVVPQPSNVNERGQATEVKQSDQNVPASSQPLTVNGRTEAIDIKQAGQSVTTATQAAKVNERARGGATEAKQPAQNVPAASQPAEISGWAQGWDNNPPSQFRYPLTPPVEPTTQRNGGYTTSPNPWPVKRQSPVEQRPSPAKPLHQTKAGCADPSDDDEDVVVMKQQATRSTRKAPAPAVKAVREGWNADEKGWGVIEEDNDEPPQLFDWEGNWLPAPCEWEGRKSYRPPKDFYEMVYQWEMQCPRPHNLDVTTTKTFTDGTAGDVADRAWIPPNIDGHAPQSWWEAHVRSFKPDEVLEPNAKPWWAKYMTNDTPFLANLIVPDAQLNMQDHSRDEWKKYKEDLGSKDSCRKRKEAKEAAKARKAMKEKMRELQIAKAEAEAAEAAKNTKLAPVIVDEIPEEREIRPKVNIYMRQALAIDQPQITDIYNWYIDNTTVVPDVDPITIHTMGTRLTNILLANLPFVVVIERTSGRGRKQQNYVHEKVLGFGYADDHHDERAMYKYTVELEFFVHKDYLSKSIGSCLFDRLLFLLDPLYSRRGGYDFRSDDEAYLNAGGKRVLSNVLINLPYPDTDEGKDHIKRMRQWLVKEKFRYAGEMVGIGIKELGKGSFSAQQVLVNTALFQYTTGSIVQMR